MKSAHIKCLSALMIIVCVSSHCTLSDSHPVRLKLSAGSLLLLSSMVAGYLNGDTTVTTTMYDTIILYYDTTVV